MNSKTIEKWQAKQIADALFPGTNYLVRLLKSMERIGFPPDDDFFRHVCAAYDAMNRLRNLAHYLSCSGVGAPSVLGQEPLIEEANSMCGRYVRFTPSAVLKEMFGLLRVPDLPPSYNVAPTQNVVVARERDGEREGVAVRWGLIPSWAKDKKASQINARSETVATKPFFRSAFKKRRCLVLADGYYEWKKLGTKKQPYLFRLKANEPFAFAGLWETWHGDGEPIESCAIITTDANELSRTVHDRMPVILRGADVDAWIDPEIEDAKALVPLLRPFPAEEMIAIPVSARVNKVGVNDAGLIEQEGPTMPS